MDLGNCRPQPDFLRRPGGRRSWFPEWPTSFQGKKPNAPGKEKKNATRCRPGLRQQGHGSGKRRLPSPPGAPQPLGVGRDREVLSGEGSIRCITIPGAAVGIDADFFCNPEAPRIHCLPVGSSLRGVKGPRRERGLTALNKKGVRPCMSCTMQSTA
jgi:hypothetical protein